MIRLLFITLLSLFCHFLASAQCDIDLTLETQTEVDNFRENYGECTFFRSITLNTPSNSQDPITGLDSLIGLTGMFELNLRNLDSLKSLRGLDSLRFVNRFFNRMRHNLSYEGLEQLDSVFLLRHDFVDENQDLSMYENINYINEDIIVNGSGIIAGLGEFNSFNGFSINIWNNEIGGTIDNIYPSNEIDSLWRVSILDSELFFIDLPSKIKVIENLAFRDISGFTISNSVLSVKKFSLGLLDFSISDNNFGNGFVDEELGILVIRDLNLNDLEQIIPNLKHIGRGLFIENSLNDNQFSFFDNFELPTDPVRDTEVGTDSRETRLLIEDNPELDICNSPFVCKALLAYPDSVFISGNGALCEKDLLLDTGCISNTSEQEELDLFISPQPVVDRINISTEATVESYELYNYKGKLIAAGKIMDSSVDVSSIRAGFYILKLQTDTDQLISKKIIVTDRM